MRDRASARREIFHAHDWPRRLRLQQTACILEVVPGERIVWSSTMKDGYRPNEFIDDGCNGFPFTAIHTFEDAGDAKTRYTATVLHATAKDRDAHDAMGFDEGWGTCADQMAEVARDLAANA
jgi:uncharacterized protein YndB with AHSA1/START domain